MSARRLRVRIPIGTALVLLVFAITAYDAHGGAVRLGSFIAAALGAVALFEYERMVGLDRKAVGRTALAAGTLVLFARAAWDVVATGSAPLWVFGVACAAPFVASVLVRRRSQVVISDLHDLAIATLGLLIVVFPMLCLIEIGTFIPARFSERACSFFSFGGDLITEKGVGSWLLLATLFTSKLNDIGGYLVGSMVGRTPLAPGVSPKKSIEGSVAGLVLGTFCAWWTFTHFCPTAGVLSPGRALAFGVIVSIATQLGDLGESLIKRASGVKDSAALIPAFGGVFDLVDSFILAAPAGYTLLRLWNNA